MSTNRYRPRVQSATKAFSQVRDARHAETHGSDIAFRCKARRTISSTSHPTGTSCSPQLTLRSALRGSLGRRRLFRWSLLGRRRRLATLSTRNKLFFLVVVIVVRGVKLRQTSATRKSQTRPCNSPTAAWLCLHAWRVPFSPVRGWTPGIRPRLESRVSCELVPPHRTHAYSHHFPPYSVSTSALSSSWASQPDADTTRQIAPCSLRPEQLVSVANDT